MVAFTSNQHATTMKRTSQGRSCTAPTIGLNSLDPQKHQPPRTLAWFIDLCHFCKLCDKNFSIMSCNVLKNFDSSGALDLNHIWYPARGPEQCTMHAQHMMKDFKTYGKADMLGLWPKDQWFNQKLRRKSYVTMGMPTEHLQHCGCFFLFIRSKHFCLFMRSKHQVFVGQAVRWTRGRGVPCCTEACSACVAKVGQAHHQHSDWDPCAGPKPWPCV